jgi:hypothetical protein
MGDEKRRVARRGKNIIFRRGGEINIVFGPKYTGRPLSTTTEKRRIRIQKKSYLIRIRGT